MAQKTLRLVFNPETGEFETVYDDLLRPVLHSLGLSNFGEQVKRASHVEPCEGGWNVDMTPVGGPATLGTVFPTRAEALAAEVDWLEKNYFGIGSGTHEPLAATV